MHAPFCAVWQTKCKNKKNKNQIKTIYTQKRLMHTHKKTNLVSQTLSSNKWTSPKFLPPQISEKKGSTPTLVGKGHSSSSSAMTAGPRGSSRGMTRISDLTTFSQPVSQSATLCSITMASGGSWSLHTKRQHVSSNQAQHQRNAFHSH